MFDCVVLGGTVVDGTGTPGQPADVGIQGGRVVAIGDLDEPAVRTIDADGLVVAPGVVDIHTHYDAQIHWDPYATPSSLHGVTSVIGGNCGFSIAPLHERDADYVTRMLARVEGMPLATLLDAVPWDWETFGEYLDRLEGCIGVNAGFLVGHTAIRRYVLGDESHRRATESEVAAMVEVLHASLAAGGLGFSSSWARTHNDAEGNPVPSRFATRDEFIALSSATREHTGTTLEFIPGIGRFTDEQIDLMTAMSVAADRPLNWNLLDVTAATWADCAQQLSASDHAAERGGRVVALALPLVSAMRLNFKSGVILDALPGWEQLFRLPPADRLRVLADPAQRAGLRASAETTSALQAVSRWGELTIGETFAPGNAGLAGRGVAKIAAERGIDEFQCLLDIVVADDLRTVIVTPAMGDDEESWRLRRETWRDPRAVVGGSDSGAHLDMLDTFTMATSVLGPIVRDRQLIPLEEAVQILTDVPARLYGIRDRGRVGIGTFADLMIFDPERIGPGQVHLRTDLPARGARLYSDAEGVEHVLVNGVEVVRESSLTHERPGVVLRSGRDTDTVHAAAT
jgi:N-acyl-D-aspartate/D-glutamate deacylase